MIRNDLQSYLYYLRVLQLKFTLYLDIRDILINSNAWILGSKLRYHLHPAIISSPRVNCIQICRILSDCVHVVLVSTLHPNVNLDIPYGHTIDRGLFFTPRKAKPLTHPGKTFSDDLLVDGSPRHDRQETIIKCMIDRKTTRRTLCLG
jgi:hypothetical protein